MTRRAWIVALLVGLAIVRLVAGLGGLGVVAIAAELVTLVFLVVRARRLVRRVRALRAEGHGLPTALDLAFRATLPIKALASVLAMEVATLIFATTGWFRKPPVGFAMHKSSGILMILGVLSMLAVVEAVVVHIVLVRISPILAIVMTALSAYGLLWLVGVAHAIRLSPLRFTPHGLVIERGVMKRAIVPAHVAVRATPATASSDAVDLSYVEPNLLLELDAPVEVHGPFWRARSATKLLLSVDDRDAFLARLAERVDHRVVDGAA